MKESQFEQVLGIMPYNPPVIGFQFTAEPPCLQTRESEVADLPLCLSQSNKPHYAFNDHLYIFGSRYNLDDVRTANGARHLIPYCLILTSDNKLITYRRKGNEGRLNQMWSMGIGGHVDISCLETMKSKSGYDIIQPRRTIFNALMKELREEVQVVGDRGQPIQMPTADHKFLIENDLYLIGEINLDGTAVDSVHTGVVFLLKTKYHSRDIKITDGADKTVASTVVAHPIKNTVDIFMNNEVNLELWTQHILDNTGVRVLLSRLVQPYYGRKADE